MEKPFESSHKLEYLQSNEPFGELDKGVLLFGYKIGTCHGVFFQTEEAVVILVVMNDEKGNGHFDDVLEWFEYSAKRQGLYLDVAELFNQRLKWHLISKRGFVAISHDHVRKKV